MALLTDAGTPGVADPGLSAVRAAIEAGGEVTAVPGPSAVTMAVAVSGLPGDRFVFEGFLPRSGSARSRRVSAIASETRTVVLFCSPKRLAKDLADLAASGDRAVVVCRELTKRFEEVWRGSLSEAARHWAEIEVRGEITVVVAGVEAPEPSLDEALVRVRELTAAGVTLRDAVRDVAEETGVRRRALYEAAVAD